MLKGISNLVVTILILMIVATLVGLFYIFSTTLFSSIFETGTKLANQTGTQLSDCLIKETLSFRSCQLVVRNCGKTNQSNLVMYIDSESVSSLPSLSNGNLWIINLTDYGGIPKGDHNILVTSDRFSLKIPFKIETGGDGRGNYAPDGFNFSVASQTTSPQGLVFNGTHFWIIGASIPLMVYRYRLDGVYDNNFSVFSTSQGLTSNFTYFWIHKAISDVFRFRYSPTYDNYTYDGWFFSAISQAGTVVDLSTNGTHFWILDQFTQRVYRYNSTGNYDNWNFSVSEVSSPTGLFFNGTYFWVSGWSNRVYRYAYNQTYDNYSYDGWNFPAGTGNTNIPSAISFDGIYFWILGWDLLGNNDRIYRYVRNTCAQP